MDLQCGETGWFAVALLPMRAAAMPLQGAAHDSSSTKMIRVNGTEIQN
jgi:hypothetical protein